jgi:ubiquinone/menaquinone biosynthesis C-methylase UbiE
MHHGSSTSDAPATAGHVLHWARYYDAATFLLTFGRERRMRRETVERAGVKPGHSVLDVGCGTGSLTLAAKAAAGPVGDVHGIDPAPEMIEVSRKKAARKRVVDIDFQAGVIEDLPFPDATFDVVLSSLMLHHLPGDLKRRGLAEVARVLKPGGRFFAVDMTPGSGGFFSRRIAGHFIHRHVDDVSSLAQTLADAGLRDIASGKMSVPFLGYITGVRA